jgi:hypothetical protein
MDRRFRAEQRGMIGLAAFAFVGIATLSAVWLARHRWPATAPGLFWRIALLAMVTTTVVVVAAQLAGDLLWVKPGELAFSALKPAFFACAGVFPAFIVGLLFHPSFVKEDNETTNKEAALSVAGGILLAAALGVLAVVSAQAALEVRLVLSRQIFLALLFGSQTLLLASPALGFATAAWTLKEAE